MKLKDVANIKFCLATPPTKGEINDKTVLMQSNLADKTILDLTNKAEYDFEVSKYKVDDDAIIEDGSIIIKRVSPTGIAYVEKTEQDLYVSGNMVLVKAIDINPKYLACVLNKKIPKIIKAIEHTRIPVLTRQTIDEIDIPNISPQQQKAIGELWASNYKLNELKKRKILLEKTANELKVYKFIDNNKEK